MYCKNCGTYLENNANYCHTCGAVPEGTVINDTEKKSLATKTMVLGIVSIALSWFGIGLGIPGIILAIIAFKNAQGYVDIYGETCKKVQLGHCLAKAGLIVGIITAILMPIIFIAYFVLYAGLFSLI